MGLSTWCAGLRQKAGRLLAPQVIDDFACALQPCSRKRWQTKSARSDRDDVSINIPRNRQRDSTTMRHVMKTLVTVELPINIRRMPAHVQPEHASQSRSLFVSNGIPSDQPARVHVLHAHQ